MAVVETTSAGWFDYLANLDDMVDYDYASVSDYDDVASKQWRASRWLMSTESQSRTTDSPIFYTWENELSNRIFTVNGAATTGELTLTLDSTTGLIPGLLLQSQSSTSAAGRFMRIASITSSTVIVVVNSAGAATIADNQELRVIAPAVAENATTGQSASFVYPNRNTNRTHIIQRRSEFTKTEMATKLRAESAIKQKNSQRRWEYEKDLDHVILSSTISVNTTTAVNTSKGIIPQILGNSAATKINAGGDELAYTDFTQVIAGVMQWAESNELIALMGTSAMKQMAELGTAGVTYRTTPDDNTYGFSGQVIEVGQYKIMLSFERALKELGGAYNNYIVIIDGKSVMVRHANGLKFENKELYQETTGSQVMFSHTESHIGVQMNHVKRHGLIHNLKAA